MKTLSDNWIVEGWIDFEYKKYMLLAYLKEVEAHFSDAKLYPPLGDLIRHYEKLQGFASQKDSLKQAFPKRITGIDHKNLELKKSSVMKEDEIMKELDDILKFSIPEIKNQIEQGRSIYDLVEKDLEVEPIGLFPIYQKEGYVLFSYEKSNDVFVYSYQVKLFESSSEKFRGITFNFLGKMIKSLSNTYEQIKLDLVKNYKHLPNPATWRVHSIKKVPLEETVVPISKRMLMKMIA